MGFSEECESLPEICLDREIRPNQIWLDTNPTLSGSIAPRTGEACCEGGNRTVEVAGTQQFDAALQTVWDLLLDPAALKAAMPGCEKFEEVGPQSYDLTIRVGISAIKGTYSGNVKVADVVEPVSYRLLVTGSGKPGSVQGDAQITLAADGPAKTIVSYVGDVKAQGAIARLGSRLLGGAAKLMIGQFFKAMEKQVQDRT